MPELETKVREGGDDIEVGVRYEIENVEETVTDVQRFRGLRVLLAKDGGGEGSVMLWERPVTSPRSKCGAFITLLGSNTDKWLHKRIIFKEWKQGARIIELVK